MKLQKFSDAFTIIALVLLATTMLINLLTKNMLWFYIEASISYTLIGADALKSLKRGYF